MVIRTPAHNGILRRRTYIGNKNMTGGHTTSVETLYRRKISTKNVIQNLLTIECTPGFLNQGSVAH